MRRVEKAAFLGAATILAVFVAVVAAALFLKQPIFAVIAGSFVTFVMLLPKALREWNINGWGESE